MSNRLGFAHAAVRHDPRDWMPAPVPAQGFVAAAVNWLRGVAGTDAHEVPASLRGDLGLPEAAPAGVVFAAEIERSRLRL